MCGRELCCEAKCDNEKSEACYDLSNLPSDKGIIDVVLGDEHLFTK